MDEMDEGRDQKKSAGICYRALSFLVRNLSLYRHRQISKARSNSSLGNSEEGKLVSPATVSKETEGDSKAAAEEKEVNGKGNSRVLRPMKPLIRALSNINERSHAYIEDKKRAFSIDNS